MSPSVKTNDGHSPKCGGISCALAEVNAPDTCPRHWKSEVLSIAEIEIGGGVAALEYFGLNTTGAGGDIATATEVLNGYAAAPDGINRYVGILDGVDVFVADITPAGSRMGLIEGTLGSLVWQGSVSRTGRSWLKPPTDPDMSSDSVRIGFILESESGWRSPFQMVLKQTLGGSGWVLISVDRFNTTYEGASTEW